MSTKKNGNKKTPKNTTYKYKKPPREGNRSRKENYKPSKEEQKAWNNLSRDEQEKLEKIGNVSKNWRRFEIMRSVFPKGILITKQFIIIKPFIINLFCYSIGQGRSNYRRNISNYIERDYPGMKNVTARSYKGFIFIISGYDIQSEDLTKYFDEFEITPKNFSFRNPRKRDYQSNKYQKSKKMKKILKFKAKPNKKRTNSKTSQLLIKEQTIPETNNESTQNLQSNCSDRQFQITMKNEEKLMLEKDEQTFLKKDTVKDNEAFFQYEKFIFNDLQCQNLEKNFFNYKPLSQFEDVTLGSAQESKQFSSSFFFQSSLLSPSFEIPSLGNDLNFGTLIY
ncbi:hypothetical protein M0812_23175 [Anaeramoeba flamelloides]|uniref:Uncharacterized protein n=1 Tax=Anaeramoeba flamelloides TaxID=1746091 RepID=A0AAV7YR52_9EUKA|nr:hypothetical protein M0812_23175 [Anaeramoeba flamelloides]